MHRPDLKGPTHMQDKRGVVPIETENMGTWLTALIEQAWALLRRCG